MKFIREFCVLLIIFLLQKSYVQGLVVGVGKSDVTGPVAGWHLMGYAKADQLGSGLINRLYCRSFVLKNPNSTILLIHTDIHSIPLRLRQEVATEVDKKYGIPAANVLLHSQHTHSGPAGFHPSLLYSFPALGFSESHLALLRNRILDSIEEAMDAENHFKANLFISQRTLLKTGRNRSPGAFNNNPSDEKAEFLEEFGENKNTRMTIIRMEDIDSEKTRAVLSFFPIHTTSMTGDNVMVNSDNKGYAEYLLETEFSQDDLVAAFFQTDSGDVSPNMMGEDTDNVFYGDGRNFVEACEKMGKRQSDVVKKVLEEREDEVKVDDSSVLKGALNYFNFSSDGCFPQMGISFLAGTEDGRGVALIGEEWNQTAVSSSIYRSVVSFLAEHIATFLLSSTPHLRKTAGAAEDYVLDFRYTRRADAKKDSCHFPKRAAVRSSNHLHLIPEVLPLQVIQIGNLYLASVPFEVTSMAGQRIRKLIRDAVEDETAMVEVAALSNAYASYMTTPEEYDMQHYEGGFTLFGRNQLSKTLGQLSILARNLLTGNEDDSSERDLIRKSLSDMGDIKEKVSLNESLLFGSQTGVTRLVSAPPGKLLKNLDAADLYKSLKIEFSCVHPMDSQAVIPSFCNVQKLDEHTGEFKAFLTDHDWSVRFWYRRSFFFLETCSCQWIPQKTYEHLGLAVGSYRISFSTASAAPGGYNIATGFSSPINVDEKMVEAISKSSTSKEISYDMNDYIIQLTEEVLFGLAVCAIVLLRFILSSNKSV